MPSLNLCIIGENSDSRAKAAQALAKKSTVDDLGFYHTVFQEKIISVIDPVAYPEKLFSLIQAVSLADYALVLADAVTPTLGEIIVCLSALGKETVFVTSLNLDRVLAQTSLKNSKVFESLQKAKEYLFEKQSPEVLGGTEVVIDHCFEVKGIGTVALGLVKKGEVSVHDKLVANHLGKEVEVKSIQKNDADVKNAQFGDRVGLCLKGMTSEEIKRGTVLSKAKLPVGKEIACELSALPFCKTPIKTGTSLHLSVGLQSSPVRVECEKEILPGTSGKARLALEKEIVLNDKLLLCDLNSKGLRIIGTAKTRS